MKTDVLKLEEVKDEAANITSLASAIHTALQSDAANEIKPCPFCGSEAEVKESLIFTSTCVRVTCTKCRISTEAISVGLYTVFRGRRNVTLTREDAEEYALRRWNARVEAMGW